MPSLRQLRFLVALADHLNFSRAAEVCHVTQPTLSAGLRELEGRLGVALAERTKRSVLMTPVGAEIAARARGVLADVAEIEATAARHAGAFEGDLRLGAIPTIGPYLVPRALPLIRAAFPRLRLYLREELTESLVAGCEEGRLDLILVALPHDLGRLHHVPLFEDGYQLASAPGHPLQSLPKVTGPDLEGHGLMLLEKGHCLQRHALSAFPGSLHQGGDDFAATSLTTLISMVEEGLGITLLPQLAVDAGVAARAQIALHPLPAACPRQVVLAWRPNSAQADRFGKIAEILREARARIAEAG